MWTYDSYTENHCFVTTMLMLLRNNFFYKIDDSYIDSQTSKENAVRTFLLTAYPLYGYNIYFLLYQT